MSRVGFCINGFNGDQRDYFPFEFVDPGMTARDTYYRPALDFITAFNYIHQVRSVRVSMEITVHDDTLGTPADVTLTYSERADRVFTAGGNEQGIFESFNTNNAWPDWLYSAATISPVDSSAFSIYGTTTDVPLTYSAEDAFANYIWAAVAFEGGDVGDRSRIADFDTVQQTDYVVSAVEGLFMGMPFLVYRNGNDPWNRDGTGYIHIEAVDYWTYDGVWDATTGAQLITPVPEGY